MINSLRQRHRYTWYLLAILLPLGYCLVVVQTRNQPSLEQYWKAEAQTSSNRSKKIGFAENSSFSLNLIESKTKDERSLAISLKEEVSIPLPYLEIESNQGTKEILGPLPGEGTKSFPLPESIRYATHYEVRILNQLSGKVYSSLDIHLH